MTNSEGDSGGVNCWKNLVKWPVVMLKLLVPNHVIDRVKNSERPFRKGNASGGENIIKGVICKNSAY